VRFGVSNNAAHTIRSLDPPIATDSLETTISKGPNTRNSIVARA
jgi:hypothetical protein